MSIPRHQQTGETSETVAMLCFQRWGWNVGRDRVDEGYDLIVTPNRDRYKGHRFLVQVKGTMLASARASAYAPVERSRMRQYAADPLPVFILRVAPGDTVSWVHAQHWALLYPDRIEGSGRVRVPFDAKRSLADRAAFEAYLYDVLEPLLCNDRAQACVRAEARFLNSLDPRLGVRLSVSETRKCHEIFAKEEGVTTTVTFAPDRSKENLETLRQTVEYGLPGKVDFSDLQILGSPLLTHIHPPSLYTGQLTILPLNIVKGTVRLYAGPEASPRYSMLTLMADMTRGTRGAAVSNAELAHVLAVDLRFAANNGKPTVRFQVGIRSDNLLGIPLQDLAVLDAFAPWAEQAIRSGRITVQLRFEETTLSLPLDDAAVEAVSDILYWMRDVGRMHRVARALDSNLILPPKASWTAEEARDLALMYLLLRGERGSISLDAFELEGAPGSQLESQGLFRITSTLDATLFGQPLGEIPVVIDLNNWVIESGGTQAKYRVAPGEGATSHISHWEPDCGLPMPRN